MLINMMVDNVSRAISETTHMRLMDIDALYTTHRNELLILGMVGMVYYSLGNMRFAW